jgi:hypothetical protein
MAWEMVRTVVKELDKKQMDKEYKSWRLEHWK